MRWLPMSSEASVLLLSGLIFEISRPASIRLPTDVTERYAEPIKHPTAGAWAMPLSHKVKIFVHPEAEEDSFAVPLQPFVAAGYVSAEEVAHLHDVIAGNKGGHINIFDSFPSLWRDNARNRETMIAEGWFSEEL